MKQTVLHNQSLLDFTLHHCGKLEALFELCLANGKSLTAEIPPGTLLKVPDTIDKADDIVNFYNFKKIKPACNFVGNKLPNTPTGIDYMTISTDFIIT
jgi:hypothetical protein